MTDSSDLGISLQLSPETVVQLRRGRPRASEEEYDWNEVIPVENAGAGSSAASSDSEEHNVTEEEESSEGNSDASGELSLSPPATLPVVMVDLARLAGYAPTSSEEAQALRVQVHTALYNDDGEPIVTSNPQEDTEDLLMATHFDERVSELLESGVARHAEREVHSQNDESSLAVAMVDYPEYLCQRNPPLVVNTAQVWKRLLQPHRIPVVDRLLGLLRGCSRSLLWKRDMRQELVAMAESEERARTARQQASELRIWRTSRRQQELDKLYTVRETFAHRLELAQAKQQVLEQDRNERAALEIRQRRLQDDETLGLEAFDLASTVFHLDEAETRNILGLKDEENELDEYLLADSFGEDEYGEEQAVSEDSGDEADVEDEGNDRVEERVDRNDALPEPTTADIGVASLSFPTQNRHSKERRRAAAQKRRHRLEESQKEAEYKAKLEEATADEERMRELCTSPELKKTMAVVRALEARMQQLDVLLESLQEEEWADEEERADEEENVAVDTSAKVKPVEPSIETAGQLSLLDKILAMILGATPMGALDDTCSTLPDHVQRLKEIHGSIVNEWKEYFGRLPPSTSPPTNADAGETGGSGKHSALEDPSAEATNVEERQVELRESLGIVDNEAEDWEDLEEDGKPVVVRTERSADGAASETKSRGLRPGGHVP